MAESSSDRILAARIAGTAAQYSRQRLTPDQRATAVAALADIALGRANLLAEVAGLTAGAAVGELDEPLAAAQLCVDAGADSGQVT